MDNRLSDKRQVVLYGAFDRYNYGDNLMPILLEMYLTQKHPDKTKDIEFVFSSIKDSDLTRYACKKTVAMRNLLNIKNDSTVIVVGGEVLGADIGVLFTHVQESPIAVKALRFIRRVSPGILKAIAKTRYDAVWEYPYIPNKDSFKNKVKVVYNTVGAVPNSSQAKVINQADYISARDQRTYNAVEKICKTHLVPDSVLMMSALVDEDFFEQQVRPELVKKLKDKKFITVQACPYKVKFTAQELASELQKVKEQHGLESVLLPIGYASGHDDIEFLEKVKACSASEMLLLDELNVWEIMYVIAKSNGFYGTSLHGVITAMSFGIPHFCINDDIEKLVSFLQTWSVSPYNNPLQVQQISSSVALTTAVEKSNLDKAVEKAQQLIFSSVDEIADIL
ncbi:polysaccharide pyruvyl transferase family protein [Serratia sp. JUb9]|uniref:polysaccharide pyruvyl transferase family protein n=1 Tax=Serratia sp. JUb9 TaxID=2724469 RepID=UPI00164D5247|nr:polysaccharide pyruvyl transferase family protein [Serratia sp. JUb9]QNK31125.1 polysaccharide pyruvyl transferase family protein [Serratia sp. JUb9]QPT14954.1 polysaccharide pyruvyl transferase family protein [Serratia rubidaea]